MKTKLLSTLLIMGIFMISCSKYEDLGEEIAQAPDKGLSLKASGNCTYTLVKADNPTQDQLEAYAKIEDAMDDACWYYNTYTNRSKHFKVKYNPNVNTAQGGGNKITFGWRKSYMCSGIGMHEMAHCFGVGTWKMWTKTLIKNGVYTGYHGKQAMKAIDPSKTLKGDKKHFWPYGLGTPPKNTHTNRVNHAKIMEGMRKDGLGS